MSIWPESPREAQPVSSEKPKQRPAQSNTAPAAARTDHKLPTVLAPATLEPLQQTSPADQAQPGQSPPPAIDWNAAAADAAARFAQGVDRPKTFSPAPQAQRKPCKPRQFDAATQELMAQRLPDPPDPGPVGPDPKGNCIVVGGVPKCVRTLTMKVGRRAAAADLLKDRLASKQPVSSVPLPGVCD
jgi:hypothetical protein